MTFFEMAQAKANEWIKAGGAIKRIKTLTGYAAHARFNAELADPIVGYVPRMVTTPYASGPTHTVYSWHGRNVFVAETRHRRYEVFEVVSGAIAKEDE